MLKELPDKIEGWHFVPMLFGNQSPLERQFSSFRGSNHDYASNFGGEVTNKCTRQANTAQVTCPSYTSEDCATESNKFLNGTVLFASYQKMSKQQLETWLRKRKDFGKSNVSSTEEAGTTSDGPFFISDKLSKLASTMSTHTFNNGYVDKLMDRRSMQR